MKHSKQKGNLGFSSTVKELHKLGINVFSEIGDLSRIDIIAEIEDKLVKIQVKYAKEKNNTANLSLRKCGPNGYKYVYTEKDVDIFALYLPISDKILFIPAKLACKNVNIFRVRTSPTDNNQSSNCHFVSEFEDFYKAVNYEKEQTIIS